MQLKSTRHSVYLCDYHIIFIPKYRRHVLTGKIAEKLKEIFYEIAYKYGIEIIAVEVMSDPVNLFVSAPPRYAASQIVKHFKGISSKWLKKYFQILDLRLPIQRHGHILYPQRVMSVVRS